MKPFNVEAWKAGDIALARDGVEVTFVIEIDNEYVPLVGRMYYDGNEEIETYTRQGHIFANNSHSGHDLIGMKPKLVKKHFATFKPKRDPCPLKGYTMTTAAYDEYERLVNYINANSQVMEDIQYHEVMVEE